MQLPVVILENDALSESRLSHMLETDGFEVLDVHSENTLHQLIEQTALSVAFISIDVTRSNTERTVQMIRSIASEVVIVLTAHSENTEPLAQYASRLGTFRMSMPPDFTEYRTLMSALSEPDELLEDDDLEIIHDDNGGHFADELPPPTQVRKESYSSPIEASPSTGSGVLGPGAPPPLASPFQVSPDSVVSSSIKERSSDLPQSARSALHAFMERCFETFMALETRSLELRRELLQVQDPGRAQRLDRPLRVWVCHQDTQFIDGMHGLATRLRLDIAETLTTGGEVLDRIAVTQPDLLLMSDQLPDIPAELVVQSVRGTSAATSVSLVRGWGTEQRSIELLSHEEGQSMAMNLDSVNELISVIETVKLNTMAADMGRDFARTFRETHRGFLKDYTRLRQWLEQG